MNGEYKGMFVKYKHPLYIPHVPAFLQNAKKRRHKAGAPKDDTHAGQHILSADKEFLIDSF